MRNQNGENYIKDTPKFDREVTVQIKNCDINEDQDEVKYDEEKVSEEIELKLS